MNKMSVVGLLVLIATLPACDYCCNNTKTTPVEAVVVEKTVEPVTQEEAVEVVDLDTMPEMEVSK